MPSTTRCRAGYGDAERDMERCRAGRRRWPSGMQEMAERDVRDGRAGCKRWPSGMQEMAERDTAPGDVGWEPPRDAEREGAGREKSRRDETPSGTRCRTGISGKKIPEPEGITDGTKKERDARKAEGMRSRAGRDAER